MTPFALHAKVRVTILIQGDDGDIPDVPLGSEGVVVGFHPMDGCEPWPIVRFDVDGGCTILCGPEELEAWSAAT